MARAGQGARLTDFAGGLAGMATPADPTCGPGWLCNWHAAFGGGADPAAVAGAAHLCLVREARSGARVWRSPTNGQNQRCDPGGDVAVAPALLDVLARAGGWDMLHLQGMPPDWTDALIGAAQARGLAAAREHGFTHAQAVIDDPAGYLAGRSASTFKRKAKQQRQLDRAHPVAFQECAGEDLPAALRSYIAAEAQSWKADQGELISAVPAVQGFYAGLFRQDLPFASARIFFLRAGGRIVAGLLALDTGPRLVLLKMFYAADMAKYSPGFILLEHIIQSRLRAGQVVDFYADGPSYAPFTNARTQYQDIVIWAGTPRAAGLRLLRGAMQKARALRQRA